MCVHAYLIAEAGIDEEIFFLIDEDMGNQLFDSIECGFKKKIFQRLESLKKKKMNQIHLLIQ